MNYDKSDLSDPLLKINVQNFGAPKGNERPLPPGIKKRRYDKIIPIMTAKKTFKQFQEGLTHISVPLKKIKKDVKSQPGDKPYTQEPGQLPKKI